MSVSRQWQAQWQGQTRAIRTKCSSRDVAQWGFDGVWSSCICTLILCRRWNSGGSHHPGWRLACQRLLWNLRPVCQSVPAARPQEQVPDQSSQKNAKPNVQREVLFQCSVQRGGVSGATVQCLWLWQILQTWPDRSSDVEEHHKTSGTQVGQRVCPEHCQRTAGSLDVVL